MSLASLAVLSTGRQDFGILRSTLVALREGGSFPTELWAGGALVSPRFGRAVDGVRREGFAVALELPFLDAPPDEARRRDEHERHGVDATSVAHGADSTVAVARASGVFVEQITRALVERAPGALLLVGDRYETLIAGYAAVIAGVPVVHLHGGEETVGAFDNQLRHGLTKFASLHLVSHALHEERVLQMGEDPETVHVVGAPGLDNLYRDDLPSRAALLESLGLDASRPFALVTVHPTTLSGAADTAEVASVASALDDVRATMPELSIVVTQPNADAGGQAIRDFWLAWAETRRDVVVSDALGERRYWAALLHARAVIGNSSSGIIEAPAAGAPVVNVGERQAGRIRTAHVVDVAVDREAIGAAIRAALAPSRREELASVATLYPRGSAAARIARVLGDWHPPRPPQKAFRPWNGPARLQAASIEESTR